MCNVTNLLFCHLFLAGGIVHQKKGPTLMMFMVVLGLLSPYNFSQEKQISDAWNTREKGAPKRKRTRATGPPCMQAQGLLFTCTTIYTEKSRRTLEVFFTGSLTAHADWRHARNAGFYKFSSPTFRWRLLTHGLTSFATDMGILRWKWRNFQVVFLQARRGMW